ncbi:hypothetical protein KXW24_001085 [Aspergillus fumigatus]|nr:hypothetical protein KXW24_001085 [Aspergillus fumigatus]
MAVPPEEDAEPQQNASGAVKAFTFEAFEQASQCDNLVEIVEAPKPKENGRVTTQELCRLIKDLKQIITLQSNKLREIRADRQMLKSQYVELEEQK